MNNLFLLGFLGAAVAGIFAVMQAKKVMSFSEGNERMRKLASAIREGANAYLKQQYSTVFKVFVAVFVVLLIMAFASGGKMLSKFTPFAFVTGGVFSMLAGYIGMKIATASNARTAQAASESLNKGLRIAFSSGSVMGFTVVGLGMLDVTVWYFLLTGAFLKEKFGLRPRRTAFPSRAECIALSEKQAAADAPALALTTRDGLASIAYAITGARALHTASRLGLTVHMMGGILGMLIMAALAVLGAASLLTPVHILLYQLVWMIPGYIVTMWTRAI